MVAKVYDVIVLGLGAVGSSTLYQLSKIRYEANRKLSILGIEQFTSPHPQGSTHGQTRITREANYRGSAYVALAKRSNVLFQEIAQLTQNKFGELYTATGGLILSSEDYVTSKAKDAILYKIHTSALKHNIAHRMLSYQQLQCQFPQFKLPPGTQGYFEDMMGYLDPENCVKAQLYLARQNGAHILDQTKIVALCPRSDNQVELTDSQGNHYITKKLIICAGAWVNEFLSDTQQDIFKVYRQTTYWFEVDKKRVNNYAPKKFPVYVWYLAKDNVVYGFPVIDDTNCVKVAAEVADDYIGSYTQVTPETVNRQITKDEEMQMFNRFVQPLFNGITNKCVKSIVCLYTVSPNWEFIIDYLPNWNRNIILASPCSGHGFKHSAAIGEALAELVIYGRATIDVISAFGGALSKK